MSIISVPKKKSKHFLMKLVRGWIVTNLRYRRMVAFRNLVPNQTLVPGHSCQPTVHASIAEADPIHVRVLVGTISDHLDNLRSPSPFATHFTSFFDDSYELKLSWEVRCELVHFCLVASIRLVKVCIWLCICIPRVHGIIR